MLYLCVGCHGAPFAMPVRRAEGKNNRQAEADEKPTTTTQQVSLPFACPACLPPYIS